MTITFIQGSKNLYEYEGEIPNLTTGKDYIRINGTDYRILTKTLVPVENTCYIRVTDL